VWRAALDELAQVGGFCISCIGQGHVAQVLDESYADHPTAPDADATISQCIDA